MIKTTTTTTHFIDNIIKFLEQELVKAKEYKQELDAKIGIHNDMQTELQTIKEDVAQIKKAIA